MKAKKACMVLSREGGWVRWRCSDEGQGEQGEMEKGEVEEGEISFDSCVCSRPLVIALKLRGEPHPRPAVSGCLQR